MGVTRDYDSGTYYVAYYRFITVATWQVFHIIIIKLKFTHSHVCSLSLTGLSLF